MRYETNNPDSTCATCGHSKAQHYKGRGMCERQVIHSCNCSRFKYLTGGKNMRFKQKLHAPMGTLERSDS
jgi:hypothetical protein